MSATSQGIIFAIVTALSWSVLAIFLKYALNYASTGTIVALRMGIAFGLLLVYFVFFKREQLRGLRRLPVGGVIAGLMLAANYWGYMKGIEYTTVSLSQVLIQIAPLGFSVVSIFLFKEKSNWLGWVGTTCAALGFFIFSWDQLSAATVEHDKFVLGYLGIILAAITWIVFACIQKSMLSRWNPQQINLVIWGIAGFGLAPMLDWHEVVRLDLLGFLIMLSLGLNTLIAYGSLAEALKRAPGNIVGLICSINPLLTLALMWCIDRFSLKWVPAEPLTFQGIWGAVLVVGGVALAVTAKTPKKLDPDLSR